MSTTTRVTPQRVAADTRYLRESLDTLERVGCQFWACDGPTLRPKPMITCNVCDLIARLRRRLGEPIRQGIEGSVNVNEAERLRYLRSCTR